ncbi:MAG: hypothetical protein FWG50_07945 [Kiritimatiellaeota bacterium]|nr:hypothetical protein [Kiritimatiellota bacterium]
MKFRYCLILVGAALPLCAQEVAVEAEEKDPKALQWNAGGDFRIRQEIYDRLPGANGNISKYNSYYRMRARAWGEVKNEDFTLYVRVADEFREYMRDMGHRYGETPGEIILDNLYLDIKNLFWDRVDLRVGRQDFIGRQGYGEGRVIAEGTPMDGSRSFYFDAVKAVIKFDDKNTLDVLGIYNSAKTFSLGTPHPINDGGYLPLNCVEPWSTGMAEWGGALYFKSKEWDALPFDLYYIYTQKSSYRLLNGTKMQGRTINTAGARVMPQITDTLSAEIEVATQYGAKDSGAIVGGQMGYAGLTYKMPLESTAHPYTTLSVLYMSGDRNRGTGRMDDRESDRSWDPLWARYTFMLNEMYVYRGIYGVGYWSNLVYPALEVGCKWENKHEVFATFGPMLTAVKDGVGGGDGALYGWFLRTRYDFPLWTGFINKEKKRGNLLGHVTAELLEPGDYCTSSKMAYFLRWEVSVAF